MMGDPEALIFPSARNKPLSDMALAAVLRRMEVPVTVHGFHATFRTWADEATAYPHAVKETALAHAAGQSAVEKAYLRSDLFNQRVALMDDWANTVAGAMCIERKL
jgi:integrase